MDGEIIGELPNSGISLQGYWTLCRNSSNVVTIVLLLCFAAILWVGAERIARLMVADKGNLAVEVKLAGEDLQTIGFSVIGLFVLIQGVPHLAGTLFSYWFMEKGMPVSQPMTSDMKVQIGIAAVQVLLGAGLLFGARSLAGLLRTVRRAGLENSRDDAE